MITETKPSTEAEVEHPHSIPKRMIRLQPTQSLGERFPAMHLVRSSWFARMLSRLLFLLLVGLVFAGIFLPWQQTSRGEGVVVARLPQLRSQSVEASTKGVIKSLMEGVREGTPVKEGDLIMEIEPYSKDQFLQLEIQKLGYKQQLAFSEGQLVNAKDQQKTEKDRLDFEIEAIDAKIKSAEKKVEQAQAKEKGQKAKLAQATFDFETMTNVRGQTVAEILFQKAKNDEINERQELEAATAAVEEASQLVKQEMKSRDGKIKDNETKMTELQTKIFKAGDDVQKYKNSLSELEVKLGESQQLEMRSPSTGIIQGIFGQVGARNVKEGDKLFEVIPKTSDLAVELIVMGNDYPLISVGDEVRLQFEGWPAIQFVGWPSVAVGTFGGKVIAKNPSVDEKGNFIIIVAPDPDQPVWPDSDTLSLSQGVRANGWVILRTVPLGFEIWRQLNGFPPGKSDPGTDKGKEKDPKLPKFK